MKFAGARSKLFHDYIRVLHLIVRASPNVYRTYHRHTGISKNNREKVQYCDNVSLVCISFSQ
jgi:hypothetical protein